MPTYKSDKPDFDVMAKIAAKDSEGNIIADAPIPAGFSFTVTSDNPACIEVSQDPTNAKSVHYHIGGPNPDSTPSQANVVASLMDATGNLVSTGGSLVTVTVGDPTEITSIDLGLPEN